MAIGRKLRRAGAFAVAAAAGGAASAQPAATTAVLDPVTVTATRTPERLSEIIADVTVIGPDEIARAGAQGLAELLQRQPGVQIATTGGPATTTSVFLRGANAGQTLLLVDGLRVGSSSTGTAPFEAIPLSEIDHIEILRGPAASLYGADAIGGVVQVFTRRADRSFSANASAGYGTYNTGQFSAGASGASGALRIVAQGGYQQSAGFNAIWNPANFSYNPDRDGYTSGNGSGSLTYLFAPEQELSAQAFYSRVNAQFDAGLGFDDRTITTVQSYAVATRNRLASFWKSTLEAGVSTDDSTSKTAFGPSQFKTVERQYLWQSDLSLPMGALSLALSRREERLDTNASFAVTARNTNAVVAVYQLREGPNALQANFRHDQSTQYGGQNSGAIEYAYSFSPGFRASASYGTGFKAPTFNDLYYPGFSNPELVPETARNFEAALRYAGADVSAGMVAYRNRVKDLIVFQCDADFRCAPQNVASATLEGVTLELQALLGGASVKGSLDFARPYDDATGNLLPRRARSYGSLQIARSFGEMQIGAQLVASSARYEDAVNARRMGGYALVNLNAEYALAREWALFAVAGNVFDKNYELSADYKTPGANVFAGVRYRY